MAELAEADLEPIAPPENGTSKPPPAPAPPPPADGAWRVDSAGREYIPKPQGRGMIYREEGESVKQALDRDARPRDKRPRRSKRPKMPEATRKVDLKELEHELADAFRAPAAICGMVGDSWGAQHFEMAGPFLARNLINASEHNPWLRRKLEDAASGQDAMMKVMVLAPVASALVLYTVPPVVYWLNLPAPDKTREMFGIPPRRERKPEYAAGAETAPLESPIAA